MSAPSVAGGDSAIGTVTLTGPAPAGGMTVALSSNNSAATVPASVVVPAGETSVAFPIATVPVSTAVGAVITGTAGDVTTQGTLTVTAQAVGTSTPSSTQTATSTSTQPSQTDTATPRSSQTATTSSSASAATTVSTAGSGTITPEAFGLTATTSLTPKIGDTKSVTASTLVTATPMTPIELPNTGTGHAPAGPNSVGLLMLLVTGLIVLASAMTVLERRRIRRAEGEIG